MKYNLEKQLSDELFRRRENDAAHLRYDKELHIYENVRDGNLDTIDESCNTFKGDKIGILSKDLLRNYKYLFVAAITLTTRFAIEGGMDEETAYTLSDVYINKVDVIDNCDDVFILHRQMLTDFTTRMKTLKNTQLLSKSVQEAIDYIYSHLHSVITVNEIANSVHISPSYFAALFKKETGLPVAVYIRKKRIESAANLLRYSDYSIQEISDYMAFSSHSHFVSVFKKEKGLTPRAFRNKYFRSNWSSK